MSRFWRRPGSRWATLGAIGLVVCGVALVLELTVNRGEVSEETLWFFGALSVWSLLALAVGFERTRRKRSTDLSA